MGHSASKDTKTNKNPKTNKKHNRQKMFRIGISVGRNDLNLEGHLQMGYTSKTIKNYKPTEKVIDVKVLDEKTIVEPSRKPKNKNKIICHLRSHSF